MITGLTSNETHLVFFIWDTTNKNPGDYSVRVTAESVPDEINLLNNALAYSKIRVKASPLSLIAMLVLALSIGFFETFSPCLIVMLSFILSYAMDNTSGYGASFLQVMLFGAGFVSAVAFLGLAFGLVFLSMPTLRISITWAVCIFAILFGLNLLGLSKMPFETKPLIKKLARKYVVTYIGIFALGFVFYFLDPCIAPIFVSMVPVMFSGALPLILFVFCLGAIIPFVGIGLFTGSVSKLARSTYRHRSAIRCISGLILIGYASYLIVFDLIL
jgi:cytochrome c biogenesis protein CcdA